MHHRIAHFDPGRPAVDQQASGLAFQCRQQGPGVIQIGVIQVQGGGQLAFEVFADLTDFIVVGALYDQRRGAEYFTLQACVSEEVLRLSDEQLRLALVRAFSRETARHVLRLRMFGQRGDCA